MLLLAAAPTLEPTAEEIPWPPALTPDPRACTPLPIPSLTSPARPDAAPAGSVMSVNGAIGTDNASTAAVVVAR